MAELECIPAREAERIDNIVRLTLYQLQDRLVRKGKPVRRGVHPKDHGCVTAKFTVLNSIAKEHQVGVFSKPGHQFDAFIRFSNADVDHEKDDSALKDGVPTHGSRGMAVKLLGVTGTPLATTNLMTACGPLMQDFLMINQPVFAFANVEDYEALSEALAFDKDVPDRFFARARSLDANIRERAGKTLEIIGRITSNLFPAPPPPPSPGKPKPSAYQRPPNSPLDNQYFGAAPFLFGEGRVMRFSAKPLFPMSDGTANFSDKGYLRAALKKQLSTMGGQDFEFEFLVQVRSADSFKKIDDEIENVCNEWPSEPPKPAEKSDAPKSEFFPFVPVAKISIPAGQDIDSAERKALCEDLIFSPWNGLAAHRPLGGINRLRRGVYEASAKARGACPVGAGSTTPAPVPPAP